VRHLTESRCGTWLGVSSAPGGRVIITAAADTGNNAVIVGVGAA